MNIIISTGVYPPDIGGPAKYAKNIHDELIDLGQNVRVYSYCFERALPIGVRHIYFFLRLLRSIFWVDSIIILDTFSTAVPSVLFGKFFGKNTLIRIGGDQLWESYTERNLVKLSSMYKEKRDLTFKEKLIKISLSFVFNNASVLAFTSRWHADIEQEAYGFDKNKIHIVPNYFGEKISDLNAKKKRFCFHVRRVGFKNIDSLYRAFKKAKEIIPDIELDDRVLSHKELLESISDSYALILPSISDIGPNFILEGIQYNRPFICTKETGLYESLKDVGIFVDPDNVEEISEAIIKLSDLDTYSKYKEKIKNFNYTHTWSDITNKYLELLSK